MAEIDDLSTTDASNTARFPENMQFRNVNDSARALEGMLAREFKDRNMSLTATGSSNAFAVTPNRTIGALADGLLIGFTANHSITGAATLNVSGLGARPIVSSNSGALSAGDIVSGQKLQVVYRAATADFQLVGDRASGTSADMTARVFPVGGIIPWPTATAPTGWLLAYGQAVSRTTYAELFAAYGTTYGSGDGSTTFNLPDYRGRTPFGKDDMGGSAASRLTSAFGPDGTTLGATGGAQSTTLATGNLPSHTHGPGSLGTGAGTAHSHVMFASSADGTTINSADDYAAHSWNPGGAISYTISDSNDTPTLGRTADESTHTHSVTTGVTAATGSGTAFSNVPPAIVQNWIILALPAAASASTIGVNGLLYQWSTGTTDANPGTGKLGLNNATVASATELYISETDAAGAGMGPVLSLWDDSTSTTKGTLYIYKVGGLSTFAVFTISGTMTDAGAYDKFTLTHVASGGTFAANDQLSVLFVPKGDKGDSAQLNTDTTWQAKGDLAVATGNDTATILGVGADGYVLVADSAEVTGVRWAAVSGTGDVTAASTFATDNRLIRSDGTGKGVQASPITADDSGNVSGVAVLSATTIELGHASDTTIARSGAGDITIEGNAVYRAGGTDVPIADGGTGASTAIAGFRALAEGLSSTRGQMPYRGASQWEAAAAGTAGDVMVSGGASGDPSFKTRFITPVQLPVITGSNMRYIGPVGSGVTGTAIGAVNRLYFVPLHFGEDKTLTEFGIYVSTLAASGVARIGLYENQGGVPGDFVADFGEVLTSTTGYKSIAISQAVVASKWYWGAVVCGTAAPSLSHITNPIISVGANTTVAPGGQHQACSMFHAYTYGALPTTNRSGETYTRLNAAHAMYWI